MIWFFVPLPSSIFIKFHEVFMLLVEFKICLSYSISFAFLGDTEMYCMLVNNELGWGGGLSCMTPPHSMLMLHILGLRHQNLKYNKHPYFKHVVPLILSIYNPVLITRLHFHLLSQVLFYHNNTRKGFTVNIVPTVKIFLLKQQLSFKYTYPHAAGSWNNKLLFNLLNNLCIIPDSTDTLSFINMP